MAKIDYDKTYGNLNDAVFVHTLNKIKWCNHKGARLLGNCNRVESPPAPSAVYKVFRLFTHTMLIEIDR